MRKHAEWMVYADERILEFLSEYGYYQPSQISTQLGEIGGAIEYHPKHVGRRCRKLTQYGLLRNLGNGLYQITELGEDYLTGDLDASELELAEE